ncbi:hypothetical protein B0H63DRAFT_392230 [Podospora didyma]|uniref:Zn(2)-C6 fungal-type domain-containing protein n=1 Tax=Podospora didyma TaxID=330526 RepID=A0AAE0NS33_9PEZI|nr:hypothetical protein B0H63DRAFT_392230 [Podospora didyma]
MQSVQVPHRPPKRRSRTTLSCDPCRIRKLKCNRQKPCQNCTTRDQQSSCEFRGPKNGLPLSPAAHRDAGNDAMLQRIDHLEGLVKKLMAEHQTSSSPRNSLVRTPESIAKLDDTRPSPPDLGSDAEHVAGAAKTVIDGVQSVYQSGDDWYAVLQEINELKKTWSQDQDEHNSDSSLGNALSVTADGPSLLFSQMKPVERLEILSTLPPKQEIDRLLSKFFNRKDFPITIPPILHEPTFMHEYNEHWKDPSRTSFMWLGLLFSILGITMLAYHQYGEPAEYEGIAESLLQLYRIRTAQCLLSGDIAKCLPYTVETLRFNATAELNRKDDNRRGLWIMTGVVVRAAINMGYHRDPAQSPDISALQAEYRRRIWVSVVTMDDTASFLGGFPRLTSAIYSDTLEPRNLHDWELSEATTAVLPPSRPLTEPTAVTYLICKGRLLRALGHVSDFNCTPTPGSYDTVLEIDQLVFDTYASFPPHLKPPTVRGNLSPSTSSSPVATMAGFSNISLFTMYLTGMCTLHRRFLAKARVDDTFKLSRERCISSALAILSFQPHLPPLLYNLSQTWYMLTLAAMMLFLELELRRKAPPLSKESAGNAVLIEVLEKSCAHWAEVMEVCEGADRVHRFLVGLLVGFRPAAAAEGAGSASSIQTTVSPEADTVPFDFAGFSFEDDLTAIGVGVNMDLDWTTWDAFLEEGSAEAGPVY